LVDDQDDAAVAFGFLGGEQVGGLRHDFGFVEAGVGAERGDDGDVEAAGAERGVGDVDQVMPGLVEGRDGGADGDGLARADFAADDPKGGVGDAEADAGDRFGVRVAQVEVWRGDPFGEWGARKAEVGHPGGGRGGHRSVPVPTAWPPAPGSW
jgi:hypothetical protein